MATLLISDLHLAPERPDIVDQFVGLVRGAARDAEALYILGDLFEAWIGDDSLEAPFNAAIADELGALSRSGVAVAFQHGNRDFLVGERFAARAGTTLLDEELLVDLGGVPTLLLHGDQLCTDDLEYQQMRARIRAPAYREALLARPLAERAAMASEYRRRSAEATAGKPEWIMDANPEAIAAAFRRHGCRRMIHGHTHRPAIHVHTVDGRARERRVLADWYRRGSYLTVDTSGARSIEL